YIAYRAAVEKYLDDPHAPYPERINVSASLRDLFTFDARSPLRKFHQFVEDRCRHHKLNPHFVMRNGRDMYNLFSGDMHGHRCERRTFMMDKFGTSEKLAAITLACDYFSIDYDFQSDISVEKP
ncbi:hypothetical protein HDU98_004407, partial [Podochytrium sp. JEL0797]